MIIYRCRNCKEPLFIYDSRNIHPCGLPSPETVIAWYGGVCPKCGCKLRPPSHKDIRVEIAKRDSYPLVFPRPTCLQKIVSVMASNRENWWSPEMLSYVTGCSKRTCYNILRKLLQEGLVIRDGRRKLRVKLKSDVSIVEVIHKLKA